MPESPQQRADDRLVHRTLPCTFKAINEKARTVDVVMSTPTIDRANERVALDWDLTAYEKNPVVLWAHDSCSPPLGRCENVRVEKGQLLGTIRFASKEANPAAEQTLQLFVEGMINAVSVGFIPHAHSWERAEDPDDPDILVLEACELIELSVTPTPMNPEALAQRRAKALAKSGLAPHADGSWTPPAAKATPELPAPSLIPIESAKSAAEQDMDLKEATEKLEKSEKALIDVRVSEKSANDKAAAAEARVKTIEIERDSAVTKATALETQNLAIVAERDKDRAELTTLRAQVIAREVDALVGVKIDPAETDLFVELATTNRPLFEKMVAQRTAKTILGGPVLKAEVAPIEKTTDAGGDNGDALAHLALTKATTAAA